MAHKERWLMDILIDERGYRITVLDPAYRGDVVVFSALDQHKHFWLRRSGI